MQLNWKHVESTVKPAEMDTDSSPTTAYVRKNIKFRYDGEGDDRHRVYHYDEAQMELDEYAIYIGEQNFETNAKIIELISAMQAEITKISEKLDADNTNENDETE